MERSDTNESNTDEDEEEFKVRRQYLTQTLKTRQLIIDFDGNRPIFSLRAPLDLVNFPSITCPRWPAECEVIRDIIHHIEWDPTEPEPFYQPTGSERIPVPVGNGKVVYSTDHATKHLFFTCSRVGGSPGPVTNPTCYDINGKDVILEFESRFESGNLQKAVQVGPYDYELTLCCDMYTKKHTQWFYFRVRNMKAGVMYRFTIVNLMKSSSLYSYGMKPLLYSEKAAREKGVGWKRTGLNIRYYRNCNQNTDDTTALYCLTWSLQFPYESDTCYLAHCYPYTYSQLQHYLQRISSNPAIVSYCRLRILCHSLAGNAVYMMTITSPGDSRFDSRTKKAVVVTARVHPGETNGSWMMEGLLDFLLGTSADAQLLRDTFVFKVVPMLNPDGVVVGNYRCSLAGRDLNRNYKTTLKDDFPCVWHTRKMVEKLKAETDVVLYCDFHGHNRKNNVFMYGCNNHGDASTNLCERVFPLMMSKNTSDKFSFKSCKFRVQKSKEGTGRIAMWRLGIRNSYTMEATFGGSTLGNRRGTHFSTRDLKSLGFSFCDTLLDYCDPDPSKANYCLTELASLLGKQVKERLGKDEMDSNLSVSDLETSTSGSNSSDSDGPPVHFLNQYNTILPGNQQILVQEKRKRLSRKERNKLRSEPDPQESNIKAIESNQSQENTTKEKHVNVDKKRNQVKQLPRKVIIPPANTHPEEISQVTLWQGSEPVMDDCLEDIKIPCSYHRTKCPHLRPHPVKVPHMEMGQWKISSQLLHLSACVPPQTDFAHPTQQHHPIPRQRLVTYKVCRGLSPFPVPNRSPGSMYFRIVPNIPNSSLVSCLTTDKLNNEHIYNHRIQRCLEPERPTSHTDLKEKLQKDKLKGLSLLRCIPLDQKSLKPISKSIKEESHKTLLVPLQKSTGKEIKRQSKKTMRNKNEQGNLPSEKTRTKHRAQTDRFSGLQPFNNANQSYPSRRKSLIPATTEVITVSRPSQSAPL